MTSRHICKPSAAIVPGPGKLPNMAKRLPSEQELQSWDCASQHAFWEQRRKYWGSGKGSGGTGWSGWKLGDLQRECRKRGIFPGGDIGFVRNRLLRFDYCPSQLLASETRTEAESVQEEMQPGVLYYKIVSSPIDLAMIKQNIEQHVYTADLGSLEKDFMMVFANAKRFDAVRNARARAQRRRKLLIIAEAFIECVRAVQL